jgi:predicted ATPase
LGREVKKGGGTERLPYLVDQLNRGREHIRDPAERLWVAELNLEAGRKAKTAAAFAPALHFFDAGIALLAREVWQIRPRLALALYREQAECQYLTGDLTASEHSFSVLLERPLPILEKAAIYHTRLLLYTAIGRYREDLVQGLAGLALLGTRLRAAPRSRRWYSTRPWPWPPASTS